MEVVLYNKIAGELQGKRSGLLEPMRLPHERSLAKQMNVGRDTIRRALAELEKKGAVTRKRGMGTFLHPNSTTRTNGLTGCNIGFVPPWWADSTSSWYTSTVFEGVSCWADEQDCHISVFHADRHGRNMSKWIEMLRARKTAGLMWVHPAAEQLPLIEHCSRFVPSVILGRCYKDHGLHHVIPDYDHASELIDDLMVEQGHESYTLIGASITTAYCQTWAEAFSLAQSRRDAKFDIKQNFIDIKPYDRQKLSQLILDLYAPVHPDIKAYFLTSSSYLAPLLSNSHFRECIKKDISLATFDFGLYPMDAYWPGRDITHVKCDWPRIGRKGMEVLTMLAAGKIVPEIIVEPVTLQQGETVKKWNSSSIEGSFAN